MTTRPLSQAQILRPAVVILISLMLIYALVFHYYLGHDWLTAGVDSIISFSLLAAGCISISNLLGYYQPKNEKILFLFILAGILTVAIVYPAVYALKYIFVENTRFVALLHISIPIRLAVGFLCIGWCALTNVLWYRLEEQAESQNRLLSAQALAKEAELNKLRHQLQPHFLFNSLNSVYALTIVNPKEAGTMITKLAAFLRGTLKRDDEVWVKVEEEMEYIQLYLDIEKVRFSHRLNIDINVAEDALHLTLPGTLLQPIVENAIKFGLYNTSQKITISVAVTVKNNVLLIRVENPFDKEIKVTGGTGFGLGAIRRRLYLLFADTSLLQTETVDDKLYITTLKIPQSNDKDNTN